MAEKMATSLLSDIDRQRAAAVSGVQNFRRDFVIYLFATGGSVDSTTLVSICRSVRPRSPFYLELTPETYSPA